ncbi:hypothetical protein D7X32_32875 [Corallococcus carmarthensis]|uniref:Uncharacterized protein n=2 Tax=Corallococcus carmarthensis TaxID=2316728 RepID=A0A3A8K4I7_9BACT|nr:hypothetical protein D7X32_32875 [Corallococcus carmarthensis]
MLIGGLCRPCWEKTQVRVEEARPGFERQDLHAVKWKDYLQESLAFTKASDMPAMYISTMTESSRGIGTLRPGDMPWAHVVAEVFANNFLCQNPLDFVFAGLVIVGGEEMIFSPPGESKYGGSIPSPIISVIPFDLFKSKIENASLSDWVCVMCHEVIHYLHWRWRIIPCLESERNAYEDAVTGSVKLANCGIPDAVAKETAGKKELLDPPADFTENGFRARYDLPARRYYGDCTAFGGQGARIEKHPKLMEMYRAVL